MNKMSGRCAAVILALLVGLAGITRIADCAAVPPRMRPYSGIGVIVLPGTTSEQELEEPLYLYQEPGISRIGALDSAVLTGNQWLLGGQDGDCLLIVMARKGSWLLVCYDDAGREGWIDPKRRGVFEPWEPYLKRNVSRMLTGLSARYYQMYRQPGLDPGTMLTPPHQLLRVLKIEDDWAMVLADQTTIGWLRWRDEDGRLTIGLE